MEPQSLEFLVSASVYQLALLVLLLFTSPLITTFSQFSNSRIHHLCTQLLHSSGIACSLSSTRKRKRSEAYSSGDDSNRHATSRISAPILSNPDIYKIYFRMSSSTFEWLAGLLEPLLDCRDPFRSPLNLPAEVRLGLGLLRLATGAGYSELARRFMVSECVSRFCVKQLCRVLCTNFRFWVAFPATEDLRSLSSTFQCIAGLPNCCGAINCIRFPIAKSKDDVSAQIVVDSACRIQSVVAVHGSMPGFRVLKSSTLYKDIENGDLLRSSPLAVNGVSVRPYLVGNEEYPLLPWLMVPYSAPLHGSPAESFNEAHKLMVASACRTALSLKSWGVLGAPIEEELKMAIACVGACSILHNALLMRGDESCLWTGRDDYSCKNKGLGPCTGTTIEEISTETGGGVLMRGALAKKASEFSNIKHH